MSVFVRTLREFCGVVTNNMAVEVFIRGGLLEERYEGYLLE